MNTQGRSSVPLEKEDHIVRLRVHTRAIELAELSVLTGAVRFFEMPTAAQAQATPFQGFAVNERGYIKAVYADMGELYLQLEKRRWRLDQPGVKIIFKRLSKKKNRVRIEASGEIVVF